MGRIVRLTQVDGKLPNLALMRLARHHRALGDEVHFTRKVERDMLEPEYDVVYGSAIFETSAGRVGTLMADFPGAIVGGTWDQHPSARDYKGITVEDVIGTGPERYDYAVYPGFDGSVGYTSRGCRFKCRFCVVPTKEGKTYAVSTIADIWRGEGHPRHLHLLDNDFFGQPREQWEGRVAEIREGGFKVCLSQGVNVRMIDDASAAALASIPYHDDSFKYRRLYTAWDNLGDEERFFKGIATLRRHGVPPTHLMAYMLVGFDPKETWERIMHRFDRMTALGIRPYPMPYQANKQRRLPVGGGDARLAGRTLGEFQRWAVRKAYNFVPFVHYDANAKGRAVKGQGDLFDLGDAA